jgi:hypothetical protein
MFPFSISYVPRNETSIAQTKKALDGRHPSAENASTFNGGTESALIAARLTALAYGRTAHTAAVPTVLVGTVNGRMRKARRRWSAEACQVDRNIKARYVGFVTLRCLSPA